MPWPLLRLSSLGAVENLENQRPGSRPRQLTDLMHALDDYAIRTKSSPTIVWIPGHLGIQGNETADDLCKCALHHDAVDIPTTLEYPEARTIYRDFSLRKWQVEWATSDTGSHYRALEPTVSLARKFADPNRKKEVAINRLRHSCLNHQLHLWGRHASRNCDGCGVPETIATSFWSALPRWASRTTSPGHAHVTTGLSTCAPHSVSPAA